MMVVFRHPAARPHLPWCKAGQPKPDISRNPAYQPRESPCPHAARCPPRCPPSAGSRWADAPPGEATCWHLADSQL